MPVKAKCDEDRCGSYETRRYVTACEYQPGCGCARPSQRVRFLCDKHVKNYTVTL
jgi:hypothetical protein